MAALAGVDLDRRRAGGADALGVVGGLLVAFDHADRKTVLQLGDGADQQCGLAGAGARDQVKDEHLVGAEARAVVGGETVVLAEDVALDLDDAVAAQAGDRLPGRVGAAIDKPGIAMRVIVVRAMMMVMAVPVVMMMVMALMIMVMVMIVIMAMIMRVFDGRLAVAAAADRTHQSTSSSFTRISSPPVTCN